MPAVSRAVLARLEAHDWPGNVRELMSTLERDDLGRGHALELPDDLPCPPRPGRSTGAPRFESAMRVAIEDALRATRGKLYGAAIERQAFVST